MPKRSDPTAGKLRALIESHRAQKKSSKFISQDAILENDAVWTLFARNALSLSNKDTPVGRAFAAFELNDENPSDWRTLIELLASVLFPESSRIGRPPEWNWERYCELLDALDKKRRKHPKISEELACERMAKDEQSPGYFRKSGAEGLRKALQKARYFPSPLLPALKKAVEQKCPAIPNLAWCSLADVKDGVVGLKQYEALAKKIAADPKGSEALLLARFREWKKRRG